MIKLTKTKAISAGGSVPISMAITWMINHFGGLALDAEGLLMVGTVVGAVLAYAAAYLPKNKEVV